MAESTALEALTAELLGDVGVLHDQVKALREVLPAAADDFTSRVELQTGHLLRASQQLVNDMKGMVPGVTEEVVGRIEAQTSALITAAQQMSGVMAELALQVDEYVETAHTKAAEGSKAEIRQTAIKAADEAMRAAVGREIGDAVKSITDAAASLVGQADKAKGDIGKEARQASWGAWKLVAVVAVASLLAAIAGNLIVRAGDHFSAKSASVLSADDQQALADGRRLAKAWPSLKPSEQQRIIELAKAAR